jgi:hypothetical protein
MRADGTRSLRAPSVELGTLMARDGITEPEQRLACKIEAEARGLMRHSSVTDRTLQHTPVRG